MSPVARASTQRRSSRPPKQYSRSQQPAHSERQRIQPSVSKSSQPFTLDQELVPFGSWVGDPIWVPPKDSNEVMAKSMLARHGAFASRSRCWETIIEAHRGEFTQVREFDMREASIRLPKGKLFVEVTEREDFDKIEDPIPACVQTRLEEFLAGPGKQPGVKVYYLKPLCVEVGDDLIFTTHEDVMQAIEQIQKKVLAAYRRMYVPQRTMHHAIHFADAAMYLPKKAMAYIANRRQRAIDRYQARLEFNRRKTALRAAKVHRRLRTDGCEFDDMLELTNPLRRADVIEQYGIENELSRAQRDRLLKAAGLAAIGSIPWFMAISIGVSYLSAHSWSSCENSDNATDASMCFAGPTDLCRREWLYTATPKLLSVGTAGQGGSKPSWHLLCLNAGPTQNLAAPSAK